VSPPHDDHDLDSWDGFVARLYAQNEFAIKLGLESMRRALGLENHPEQSHGRILVAGTNGKGGTASFLASILQAHNLRVGLYTSPHIIGLEERFRVQGRPVDREAVHRVGRSVLSTYGDPQDGSTPRLTFFELTTLMAAKLFADADVDVSVYEVGLGGRLDATNALEPQLCVITSIGLDHQKYLGDDLASVAREKCGIIRDGVPLVVGRQSYDDALDEIASHAPETTYFYDRDYTARDDEIRVGGVEIRPELRGLNPPTRLWNAGCAAAAAHLWLDAEFTSSAAKQGLEHTYWPGRMDLRRLPDSPEARTYLFDAAHNPDSSTALWGFLAQSPLRPSAVVFGGMRDKDLERVSAPVPEALPVFAAEIESPRAANADELRDCLAEKNLRAVGPTAGLLERAALEVDADDVVLVFGSVYLIGEAFRALGVEARNLRTWVPQPAPT
jgi:dihydrofolate synthase/folylpolyglutamate synthase